MYISKILADKPFGVFSMDAASPFPDLSGNGNNATASGTFVSSNTLVAGGGKSTVVNSAYTPTFVFPLLKSGYETRAWTWETWFHPLKCNNSISILKHAGSISGFYYDGQWLTFKLDYNSITITLEYEVIVREAMHIAVTHVQNRLSLYVNGINVDTVDVDDATLASGYKLSSVSSSIVAGQGTTDKILIDSVAFYGYDLSSDQVISHFGYGRDVLTLADIVNQQNGSYIEPNDTAADVFLYKAWDTDADFATSTLYDCSISNGITTRIDVDNNPVESTWNYVFNIDDVDPPTLNYLRVGWDGSSSGFVVELILDGDAPISVSNNVAIYLDAANHYSSIELKLTFYDVGANVSYLDFVLYSTSVIKGSHLARSVDYSGIATIARTTNEPIEHNINRGIDLSAGGYLRIQSDLEASPVNTKTIDIWTRFTIDSAIMLLDLRTSSDTSLPYIYWSGTALSLQGIDKLYVNGQQIITPSSWVPLTDDSYLITVVFSTANNLELLIGADYLLNMSNNGQIESLALYDTEPTVIEILRMYNSYFGIVTDTIPESASIAVSEPTDAYNLYSYVWSIESSES